MDNNINFEMSQTKLRIIFFLQISIHSICSLFLCWAFNRHLLLWHALSILHLKWRSGQSILLLARYLILEVNLIWILVDILALSLLIVNWWNIILHCVSIKSWFIHKWVVLFGYLLLRFGLEIVFLLCIIVARFQI